MATATSFPRVKLVGEFSEPIGGQHVGSVTLSERNGRPHAARYGSDHHAPFGRCPDSLSEAECKIAVHTNQGAKMRSQEIL